MKATLIGAGWVTPHGRDLPTVWQTIRSGTPPPTQPLENPRTGRTFPVARIAPESVRDAAAFPRLRRSSVISHFALAAALDAVSDAALDAETLSRTALVFAASDGGVVYTRRFYADVVGRDAGAGSPLLFPETVYNAPASHIAARLGLAGEVLTLVGDAAAGLSAIGVGCEILASGEADFCLVVSAQELDWVTCEAYRHWGLVRTDDPGSRGAVFSEGAAAVVLAREGGTDVRIPEPSRSYTSSVQAKQRLEALVQNLLAANHPGIVVSAASGTAIDAGEEEILTRLLPDSRRLAPKHSLGESLACSALQQVITGLLALRFDHPAKDVLVSCPGFNGQVAALILTGTDSRA